MQKKDNKVGNKTTKKEGKKEKKRTREKNRNRFARKTTLNNSKFWLLRMRQGKKSRLITSGWSENMPFFLQNSLLAIVMLIKEELVKNNVFSLLAGRHQRVKLSILKKGSEFIVSPRTKNE